MKYFSSANECCLTPTHFTQRCIELTNRSGIISYTVFMLASCSILLITWPGNSNSTKATDWLKNIYAKVWFTSKTIWNALNLVSTLITFIGIYKIL